MTTQAAANKAARTYKATQPVIDAVKDTVAENAAAKKVLIAYMVTKELDVFRGISLKIVSFTGWNMAGVAAYLGDKAAQFRVPSDRNYLSLVKRAKQASKQP